MKYPLPPGLAAAEQCRWCEAPGKLVALELIVGPRLCAVVCVDVVACVRRQRRRVEELRRARAAGCAA